MNSQRRNKTPSIGGQEKMTIWNKWAAAREERLVGLGQTYHRGPDNPTKIEPRYELVPTSSL
jgi:hypothetical protein